MDRGGGDGFFRGSFAASNVLRADEQDVDIYRTESCFLCLNGVASLSEVPSACRRQAVDRAERRLVLFPRPSHDAIGPRSTAVFSRGPRLRIDVAGVEGLSDADAVKRQTASTLTSSHSIPSHRLARLWSGLVWSGVVSVLHAAGDTTRLSCRTGSHVCQARMHRRGGHGIHSTATRRGRGSACAGLAAGDKRRLGSAGVGAPWPCRCWPDEARRGGTTGRAWSAGMLAGRTGGWHGRGQVKVGDEERGEGAAGAATELVPRRCDEARETRRLVTRQPF
jgi:hypothetical protein